MRKFSHLRQRVVGAILYGGFILLAYLWNIYTFLFAVFALLILSIREVSRMSCLISKTRTPAILTYVAVLTVSGFMMFCAMSLSYYNILKLLIWLGVLHHTMLVVLIFSKSFDYYRFLPDFVISALYIGLSFGAIYAYAVPFADYEKWRVVLVLFCIWGTDIGAYFCGTFFGRLKLAPHVSPNKTWEGLLGGWLIATVLGYFMAEWIELSHVEGAILGSMIAIAAVFGDLVESKMKRMSSIKDSGKLLPGHGGILDRVDGYIYAQPFVALIFTYLI